jgi:hypothetical protein
MILQRTSLTIATSVFERIESPNFRFIMRSGRGEKLNPPIMAGFCEMEETLAGS